MEAEVVFFVLRAVYLAFAEFFVVDIEIEQGLHNCGAAFDVLIGTDKERVVGI